MRTRTRVAAAAIVLAALTPDLHPAPANAGPTPPPTAGSKPAAHDYTKMSCGKDVYGINYVNIRMDMRTNWRWFDVERWNGKWSRWESADGLITDRPKTLAFKQTTYVTTGSWWRVRYIYTRATAKPPTRRDRFSHQYKVTCNGRAYIPKVK